MGLPDPQRPGRGVRFLAFRLPEPPRGQFEKEDVLGEVIEEGSRLPSPPKRHSPAAADPHAEARHSRLRGDGVRALHRAGARQSLPRGRVRPRCIRAWLVGTSTGIVALLVLPFVGRYDRLYRESPLARCDSSGSWSCRRRCSLRCSTSCRTRCCCALRYPQAVMLSARSRWCAGAAIGRPVPTPRHGCCARLDLHLLHRRDRRALLAALLTDAFGVRTAILVLVIPSTIVGGLMILRAPRTSGTISRWSWRNSTKRWRSTSANSSRPSSSRVAGQRHRLRLRPGSGAVRRRLRVARRGVRAARHERRRQVSALACHRGPRYTLAVSCG